MGKKFCDYCSSTINGDPAHTHKDSGNTYCCDPCYDAAMDATRAGDAHDRHFGIAAAAAYDPDQARGEW